MIAITNQQRSYALGLLATAKKALAELASEAINLDVDAQEAANIAIDQINLADAIISTQPPE